MMIHTKGHFDSAHYLNNYNGKCNQLHGHRWEVEVWAEGRKLDKTGILLDFSVIKRILNKLDHTCLNYVFRFNPTAENLAIWIRNEIKKDFNGKVRVRLYESPDSWAEVK